jgi:uncharacterized protein YpbB
MSLLHQFRSNKKKDIDKNDQEEIINFLTKEINDIKGRFDEFLYFKLNLADEEYITFAYLQSMENAIKKVVI